ncbi:hypothetical protein H4R34_000756 [Dimargaris verticillata]|uniref:Uncharacterized protein n=1 Tax=Dimargaris verticillata TaxID=2761393 RepID=A0A9W8B4T4_9FUNG|nr:hypothetical protein H4R34_000756 [Dimargaris verticillata]
MAIEAPRRAASTSALGSETTWCISDVDSESGLSRGLTRAFSVAHLPMRTELVAPLPKKAFCFNPAPFVMAGDASAAPLAPIPTACAATGEDAARAELLEILTGHSSPVSRPASPVNDVMDDAALWSSVDDWSDDGSLDSPILWLDQDCAPGSFSPIHRTSNPGPREDLLTLSPDYWPTVGFTDANHPPMAHRPRSMSLAAGMMGCSVPVII